MSGADPAAAMAQLVLIVLLLFCFQNGVESQRDQPKVQFPSQDMAGLESLWEAWKNNTPNLATTFRNWENKSALPCNNDFNYSVSRTGWNGVGCYYRQINATTGEWTATVGMLNRRNNSIVGVLPPQVSLLTNLQYLLMGNNPGLSGPIPKEIGLLSSLNRLDLSWCNFSGQVPDLSNLTSLARLDLSGNRLDGPFPTLPISWKLEYLNISGNLFTGAILRDTFQYVEYFLITLDLSNNQLTCPLPKFSSSLKTLSLSNNKFNCPTPNFTYLTVLTTLNLSANHFQGLSNNMSSLNQILPQDLSVLDLSSLSIGGSLPNWSSLAPGSKLSELYLDDNNFTGVLDIAAFTESHLSRSLLVLSLKNNMITKVLTSNELIRAGQIKILLKGNPYCDITWASSDDATWCSLYCENLCKIKPEPKISRRVIIILATTLSSMIVLLLVIVGLTFKLRWNKKYIRVLQRKIKEADINAKRFEYNELRVATKNFAKEMKLGAGAYGVVYKGILANGIMVAVKQLFQDTNKGNDDFLNEVLLIANLQHKNLVTLKGYCLHGKQTLLVYEYVENCDLHKLLLGRQDMPASMNKQVLNWRVRLNICQGVAQGLYYLHASSQSRIVHRDIKASNILLNKDLQPKIADFGLARPMEDAKSVIVTLECAGTIGYVAPEYMEHGLLSDKADVYSFGVLLLEIVSGKRNKDLSMPEDEVYLPSRAWKLYKEKRLLDMKDPTLLLSIDEVKEVQRVLETAVLCVQNAPEKRPSMFQVAAMLAGDAHVDVVSKHHDSHDSDISIWDTIDGSDSGETPLCSVCPPRSGGLDSADYEVHACYH